MKIKLKKLYKTKEKFNELCLDMILWSVQI